VRVSIGDAEGVEGKGSGQRAAGEFREVCGRVVQGAESLKG
jgi:hypothetical protein